MEQVIARRETKRDTIQIDAINGLESTSDSPIRIYLVYYTRLTAVANPKLG